MNYKIQAALKKNKKNFIIYGILWIFIAIVFVMPIARSIVEGTVNGLFDFGVFFEKLMSNIMAIGENIGIVFKADYVGTFFDVLLKVSLVYLIFAVIGILKMKPKSEYTDIEHGSSDWSQGGEQYRVLSNKKGLILAEGNYLPLDKRGNVNVLVVGRFRFW